MNEQHTAETRALPSGAHPALASAEHEALPSAAQRALASGEHAALPAVRPKPQPPRR